MNEDEKLLKPGGIEKTSPSAKFAVLDPKKGVRGRDIVDIWVSVLEKKLKKKNGSKCVNIRSSHQRTKRSDAHRRTRRFLHSFF